MRPNGEVDYSVGVNFEEILGEQSYLSRYMDSENVWHLNVYETKPFPWAVETLHQQIVFLSYKTMVL